MVEWIFLFGCPGSGKSTAAHFIEMVARDEKLSVARFTDYSILDKWFQADMEGCRFRPSHHGGFDILEADVYDEALSFMIYEIRKYESEASQPPDLIVVDFARADYRSAFEILGESLIQNSHFLLLEAEIKTCNQRIEERVRTGTSLDDHFTSDFVLAMYNQQNYLASVITMLVDDYHVDKQRIREIDNTSGNSKQDLYQQMSEFVHTLKLKQPV